MQINESTFLSIVLNATSNPDPAERNRNEQLLSNFIQNSPDQFISLAASDFQNNTRSSVERITVATVFKLALQPRAGENTPSFWISLSPKSKETAMNAGLASLIDPDDQVKRAAASLVGKVFVADRLADGSWDSLIPNISNNLKTDNAEVKKAAILTLGFICEDLKNNGVVNLPKEQVDALLAGICYGLEEFGPLSATSVKSLFNASGFLGELFVKEEVSDLVFNLLLTLLEKALNQDVTNDKIEELITELLLLLGELCRLVYNNIDKYYKPIFDQVLKCLEAEVVVQSCEFFNTICQIEQNNQNVQKHLIQQNWNIITKTALDLLLKLELDNELDGLSKSGAIFDLLINLNSIVIEDSLPDLISFISEYIERDDDKSKNAALITFEAVIETAKPDKIHDFTNSGFQGLLNFIKEGTFQIQINSTRVLHRIALNIPEVMLKDYNLLSMKELFEKILGDNGDDEQILEIKRTACLTLEALADCYPKHDSSSTSTFHSCSESMVNMMIGSIQKNTELQYLDTVFSATFPFLQNVFQYKQLNGYFSMFFQYIEHIKKNFDNNVKKEAIELVFINLSVILVKFNNENLTLDMPNKNTDELMLSIYDYIVALFTEFDEVLSETLLMLTNLVSLKPIIFRDRIEEFINKIIASSLENPNNAELFKAGIESIAVFSKNIPETLTTFINQIFPYLLKQISDNQISNPIKLSLFFAIADFALHYPHVTANYLMNITNTLELALTAVIHYQQEGSPDNRDYSDALKEVVLDCYLCLIHGIYYNNELSQDAILESSFMKLIEFIKITSRREVNPTIDYLKSCLGCMVDIFGKKNDTNLIDHEVIMYIYELLSGVGTHVTEDIIGYTQERYLDFFK